MINVGVFFGSSSPEHDISIITAEFIIATIKKMPNYNVVPVYLTKNRRWLIGDQFGELKFFIKSKGEVDNVDYRNEYLLQLDGKKTKMEFVKKGLRSKKITIDVAFPAFHGSYGEDGKVQGIFEMLGVPYVGCDVACSALTMDKALTKMIYKQEGIETAKFFHFTKKEWQDDKQLVIKMVSELKWPIFVKPAHLGSSIGITKVENISSFEDAAEVAIFYDDKVVVEEGVENLMDITCAVVGNNDLRASLVQESVFQSEMFDFEEKYLKDGGTQLGKSESGIVIPARLDEKITEEIRQLSKRIFRIFGCSGIIRVDYLLNKKTGKYFANEINTMPGTLYHHLWKKSGIEIDELIDRLIKLAFERQKEKTEITYNFKSEIFGHIGNMKLGSGKLTGHSD